VIDGRDIGTKVFPNANLKFFITASAPQRAKRRYKELKDSPTLISYEDILESLILRDNQDKNNGNFDKSPQAIEIDTTNLTKEESCELVYKYTIEKLGL
jgi:cytidylate kinase